MDEVVKYLKALVALEVQSRFGDENQKPEVVLRKAGLSFGEIGALLGKSADAVQKTISRAK